MNSLVPSASVTKLATVIGALSYASCKMISPLLVSILAYKPSGKSFFSSFLQEKKVVKASNPRTILFNKLILGFLLI